MKTPLAPLALALVTIATLGTACDPETASTPADAAWRDGELIDPPTRPTGTSLVVKGGHDNPEEIMGLPFFEVPLEFQVAFDQEALEQAHAALEAEFLANDRNLAQCPWTCEELGGTWTEGVYVTDLVVEYGDVRTATDRAGRLHWTTDAYASASVGCGCI